MENIQVKTPVRLTLEGLAALFPLLQKEGYQVRGPTVKDGAIVTDEIQSIDDLPRGWTDEQGPGTYRVKKRDDAMIFGFVVGPHSWKKFLFPPSTRLTSMKKNGDGLAVQPEKPDETAYAFLGVRACEIAAIRIQDKVFMEGTYVDPLYKARREKSLIIAVNCVEAKDTCFCVSMKTGPRAETGFDLSLTEILSPDEHYFVAEAGTDRGRTVLDQLPTRPLQETDLKRRDDGIQNAARQNGRFMDTNQIKEILYRNIDHPRWDDVAKRCLTCANCTMVCPTCFCSTVEDVTDLKGENAERWRKWDSCFTMDFSYVAGGVQRASAKSRYRQWMTHKLATWIDQFDTSGCVGCGRCITWCPVGIDITEEMAEIRKHPQTRFPSRRTK